MADNGLSDEEARGFHRYFVLGFVSFTGIAIVAHFLACAFPAKRIEVKQPSRVAHQLVRSARISASARA